VADGDDDDAHFRASSARRKHCQRLACVITTETNRSAAVAGISRRVVRVTVPLPPLWCTGLARANGTRTLHSALLY